MYRRGFLEGLLASTLGVPTDFHERGKRKRLLDKLESAGFIDDDGEGRLGMVLSIENLVALITIVMDAREGR